MVDFRVVLVASEAAVCGRKLCLPSFVLEIEEPREIGKLNDLEGARPVVVKLH
jgi:hypothetical protein